MKLALKEQFQYKLAANANKIKMKLTILLNLKVYHQFKAVIFKANVMKSLLQESKLKFKKEKRENFLMSSRN